MFFKFFLNAKVQFLTALFNSLLVRWFPIKMKCSKYHITRRILTVNRKRKKRCLLKNGHKGITLLILILIIELDIDHGQRA